MTKKIKLTQGQYALVSDYRYEELNQYKWFAVWDDSTKSYRAARSVREKGKKPRHIHMSREIMNTPDGMIADHIDHDTLNNQDENLRNVTHQQNRMNQRTRSDNKLGIKNITLYKKKYHVRIWEKGVVVFYKRLANLHDAIALRDKKLVEIHGEYACGRGCA